MGWFGFGKKTSFVVTVAYEGANNLRLNGNRIERAQTKRNAAAHSQTICWLEVSAEGERLDQGTGPSAGKMGEGGAEKLLRELPMSAPYRSLLEELRGGKEQASIWYKRSK